MNARARRLVTFLGIVTSLSEKQSLNASSSISSTPEPITRLVRLLQPSNAFCSMMATLLGITMLLMVAANESLKRLNAEASIKTTWYSTSPKDTFAGILRVLP